MDPNADTWEAGLGKTKASFNITNLKLPKHLENNKTKMSHWDKNKVATKGKTAKFKSKQKQETKTRNIPIRETRRDTGGTLEQNTGTSEVTGKHHGTN